MKNILNKFRKLNHILNPPATSDQLSHIGKNIPVEFPSAIRKIYEHHNGINDFFIFPLRLMTLQEVENLYSEEGFYELDMHNKDVLICWEDGGGNYAGLYVSGLLKGKMCFIDHEDPDFSPIFRNLESFYHQLFEAIYQEIYWTDMLTDYPILNEYRDNNLYLEELALAENYIQLYEETEDEFEKIDFAFIAMNILPLSETARLLPFAHSKDEFIQGRACELLGQKCYVPAVNTLAKIALNGEQNGKIASIIALGKIGNEEAKKELLELSKKIDVGFEVYIDGALKNCSTKI